MNNTKALRCLWHHVPQNMQGSLLWPLRALEEVSAEVAGVQRAKYAGREHIANLHVPLLDCRWDEVVFFSPIHPDTIHDAVRSAGGTTRAGHAYEIDMQTLKDHELIWFDPKKAGPNGALTPESVWPVEQSTYRAQPLSGRAPHYYKRCVDAGRQPLLLGTELHVLARGFTRDGAPHPVDVSQARVIAVGAMGQGAGR